MKRGTCPKGHPADGAPCVTYKCERLSRSGDIGECELCGEREPCEKCRGVKTAKMVSIADLLYDGE